MFWLDKLPILAVIIGSNIVLFTLNVSPSILDTNDLICAYENAFNFDFQYKWKQLAVIECAKYGFTRLLHGCSFKLCKLIDQVDRNVKCAILDDSNNVGIIKIFVKSVTDICDIEVSTKFYAIYQCPPNAKGVIQMDKSKLIAYGSNWANLLELSKLKSLFSLNLISSTNIENHIKKIEISISSYPLKFIILDDKAYAHLYLGSFLKLGKINLMSIFQELCQLKGLIEQDLKTYDVIWCDDYKPSSLAFVGNQLMGIVTLQILGESGSYSASISMANSNEIPYTDNESYVSLFKSNQNIFYYLNSKSLSVVKDSHLRVPKRKRTISKAEKYVEPLDISIFDPKMIEILLKLGEFKKIGKIIVNLHKQLKLFKESKGKVYF